MSNLLSQASLVMIPSGYKEDVVYSQIPTDGSGDLSFTRASNGTRVNSAGLVEVCPWNLAGYSEDFTSSGGWNGDPVTATLNYGIAPNGTQTSTRLQFNTANEVWQKGISGQNGNRVVLSFWIKGTAGQTIQIYDGYVDKLITISSEWTRIYSDGNIANSGNININTYGGNARTFEVWGLQVNYGSTAKPYFPTTDRLNVPRLTYQNGGGGCPSLLLEKQSTNLCTYSNDISNASYNYQNSSVSGVTTTSPDGTSNAYGIVADTSTNNFHRWYKSLGALSGTYTTAIYAKKGTSKYFGIGWNQDGSTGNNNVVVYDLDLGTVASNPYSVSASIESVGNGWYRCIHTYNFGTGGSYADLCVHNAGLLSNYTAAAFQVYDSPSVSTTLYVWGVQVEQSSYATSLIPTNGSSATRVADACYKTGILSLIGQTSGTMFVDFEITNAGGNQAMIITSAAGNEVNRLQIYFNSSLQVGAYRGDASVNFVSGAYSVGQRIKAAVRYKLNDYAFYVNGVQIGTDTSASIPPTPSVLYLGTYVDQVISNSIKINQSAIFAELTNAELASLTTI